MGGSKLVAVPEARGKITETLTFKRKKLTYFIWAKTSWTGAFFEVNPVVSSGGPLFSILSSANSIMRVQPGIKKLEKGSIVNFQLHPGLMAWNW
jgi:molybdopterin biosynthesis enzyme